MKASFAAAGLNNLLIMPVADIVLLTFAAQNLVAVCEVVVAGAILVNDAIGTNVGGLSTTLVGSIHQLGLISATCVIPAIVTQSSLLEAKAVLPELSKSWARSSKAALSVKSGSVSVQVVNVPPPPAPIEVAPALNDPAVLLAAFQQTLKVLILILS